MYVFYAQHGAESVRTRRFYPWDTATAACTYHTCTGALQRFHAPFQISCTQCMRIGIGTRTRIILYTCTYTYTLHARFFSQETRSRSLIRIIYYCSSTAAAEMLQNRSRRLFLRRALLPPPGGTGVPPGIVPFAHWKLGVVQKLLIIIIVIVVIIIIIIEIISFIVTIIVVFMTVSPSTQQPSSRQPAGLFEYYSTRFKRKIHGFFHFVSILFRFFLFIVELDN